MILVGRGRLHMFGKCDIHVCGVSVWVCECHMAYGWLTSPLHHYTTVPQVAELTLLLSLLHPPHAVPSLMDRHGRGEAHLQCIKVSSFSVIYFMCICVCVYVYGCVWVYLCMCMCLCTYMCCLTYSVFVTHWRYALSLSVTGLALAHKHYPAVAYLNPLWFRVSVFTTLYCFYWGTCTDLFLVIHFL
jgi:hypothetical protein